MPYFLERAEQVLDKQRYWVSRGTKFMGHAGNEADLDTLDIRETFRNHIYGCIIEDRHALKSLDELGEDNIMCETDYPHSDSTWPNCIDVARDTMKDLPERVQYKLLRGNAERLYRFTPAEPPVLAKCLSRWRERLEGKSAIVTGAGSGVGRVSALRFARGGRPGGRRRHQRSTTPKRLCARSNRRAERPSPSVSTCRTSSRCRP